MFLIFTANTENDAILNRVFIVKFNLTSKIATIIES